MTEITCRKHPEEEPAIMCERCIREEAFTEAADMVAQLHIKYGGHSPTLVVALLQKAKGDGD